MSIFDRFEISHNAEQIFRERRICLEGGDRDINTLYSIFAINISGIFLYIVAILSLIGCLDMLRDRLLLLNIGELGVASCVISVSLLGLSSGILTLVKLEFLKAATDCDTDGKLIAGRSVANQNG